MGPFGTPLPHALAYVMPSMALIMCSVEKGGIDACFEGLFLADMQL